MKQKESDLERRCNQRIKDLGGMYRKLDVGPLSKGWLDQAYWVKGQHFIVEFKLPGEPLRPLQKRRKEQLEAQGVDVYVVHTVDEFATVLHGRGLR